MEKNPVITPNGISEATGINIRTIRLMLPHYPGAIRLSGPEVNNPRLGIREKRLDDFLDWLARQPKEAPPKQRERTKTKRIPVYIPSSGPIPYRKGGS